VLVAERNCPRKVSAESLFVVPSLDPHRERHSKVYVRSAADCTELPVADICGPELHRV
jgi:hypothetical protein